MARRTPKNTTAHSTALVRNDNGGLERTVAPWPQIDRWPILLGSNITFQYIAAAARLCIQGYRYQFVDLLNELIEKDPHAFAVFSQRILGVSGATIEIVKAHVSADAPDSEKQRAEEIRAMVEQRIRAIPRIQVALEQILWGIFYGLAAHEILWDRRSDGWWISGLEMVHSRRLNYPDWATWDLHIWDQGMVSPLTPGASPTEGVSGLRIADYPGKFLVFSPNYRGDYPTREGVGRVIAFYLAIKQMALRGGTQYVERFAKPFALAYYNTKTKDNNNPRAADQKDIDAADAALKAIGIGGLNSATLPDSIRVELQGPGISGAAAGALTHEKLIELVDKQVSKAARGGTLQTDAGDKGARSLGEVHAEGDKRNARYDAAVLAEAMEHDIVWWLVHLNCPGEEHLAPKIKIHVEQISPEQILTRAVEAAKAGVPVDAVWLAEKLGLVLADLSKPEARRLAPLKPVDLAAIDPVSEGEGSVAEALESLAAHVGWHITPALRNTIASLPREMAAQFLKTLLQAAAKPGDKPTEAAQPPPQLQAPIATTTTPPEADTKAPAQPEKPSEEEAED